MRLMKFAVGLGLVLAIGACGREGSSSARPAVEASRVKTIVITKGTFSDVYPAVWFSPSTGEIAPITAKEERPPEAKYEMFLEPGDPELSFEKGSTGVGVAVVGRTEAEFNAFVTPPTPALQRKILREAWTEDGSVLYIRGRESESVVLLRAIDRQTPEFRIEMAWRNLKDGPLPPPPPAKPVVLAEFLGQFEPGTLRIYELEENGSRGELVLQVEESAVIEGKQYQRTTSRITMDGKQRDPSPAESLRAGSDGMFMYHPEAKREIRLTPAEAAVGATW